ncbi:5931_t:CDS:2 [Funneliformis mosseae]|uniref:5931_t:CDS:1 n=1 Tax=Funneliformis mosseae TaxID=27381 RepID=A0A9N9BZ62_FUNMO|nr:5931_t:CDS:2 [Funneliformis mosseae]
MSPTGSSSFKLNSYFQYLVDEIKINIFKHVDQPFNLARSCKSWAAVAKDSYAKTEWLLARSGKTHALFVAVKLGPSFLTIPVCQNLLTRKVIISRYFVQRLLMHFGKFDQKLIDLKIEHNVNQLDADRICALQKRIKSPWASNLSLPVFLYLLSEGYNQFGNAVPLKGNDMELFHFLSAGPHVINYAPGMLRKNLKDIEDLILNQKFIPFPPRPKSITRDLNHDPHIHQQPPPEEYPPKDGYENSRQLNVIARAILIHPDLVNLWKQIGYEEICNDVNDLVLQGALLILFPPTPSSDWVCPTVSNVISRLKDLIDLGFILKDSVIIDALHMFEHRLDDIGDILWNVFCTIRSSEPIYSLACNFFREALNPERNLKKDDLLNFLKSRFDYHERVIKEVVAQYFKDQKVNDMNLRRKSLILSPKVYQYFLETFGVNSEICRMCFEDLLTLRIYIDEPRILEDNKISPVTYDSIVKTFNLYVTENVTFEPEHMDLLQSATSPELIRPFFEKFLPSVFGMSKNHKLNNSKKRKRQTDEIIKWSGKLKSFCETDDGNSSIIFKENLLNFCKRLEN